MGYIEGTEIKRNEMDTTAVTEDNLIEYLSDEKDGPRIQYGIRHSRIC